MSAKIAVSPLTWYRKQQQASKPPSPGQSVPCGSCTACCEVGRVVLYPKHGDVLASYAHHRDESGAWLLERHPDGHCLYLHEGACLIYNRRPVTCRLYDCRALLIADVNTPAKVFAAAQEKFALALADDETKAWVGDVQRKARIALVQGKSAEQQLQIALSK